MIKILPIITREGGFCRQPFAFGGEEGPETFDGSVYYRSSLQNYLIDTGSEVILVDTAFPATTPEERPDETTLIYTGHNVASYMTALANLGYTPDRISKICLTHKHADHSGQLSNFPNAKIYVNKNEVGADELRDIKNLIPVSFTDGAYKSFPESQKICDHVYFVRAEGHTKGSAIVIVEDPIEGLFYMIHGDITYVDEALYENKLSVVFEDLAKARETMNRVLDFVANNPTVYLSTHTPQGPENLEEKRVVDLNYPPETIPVADITFKTRTGKYVCSVCGFVYDPAENDGVAFEDLPDDWTCPRCKQPKSAFNPA